MPRPDQILEDAKRRGNKLKVELLHKAGGLLTAQEAAPLVGTTMQGLGSMRLLIALRMDSGDFGYPAFQFESEAMLTGVSTVLDAINVDEPWACLNFFFMHLDELDDKMPVEAIRNGSIDAVVLAARHFGDHGAS
jgi:hypothetical protein